MLLNPSLIQALLFFPRIFDKGLWCIYNLFHYQPFQNAFFTLLLNAFQIFVDECVLLLSACVLLIILRKLFFCCFCFTFKGFSCLSMFLECLPPSQCQKNAFLGLHFGLQLLSWHSLNCVGCCMMHCIIYATARKLFFVSLILVQ